MSNAAEFTITGFDELKQKLASLGADVGAEFRKAGKAAMQLTVEADARKNIETNKSNDNGILRASITTEIDGDIVKTGSSVEYAKYVEFGTGIYAEGGDGRKTPWLWKVESRKWAAIFGIERGTKILWHGSHPHPFLRPAFDMNKDKIPEEMQAQLEKIIARYTK